MKRSELNDQQSKKYCWDFTHLFASNDEWISALNQLDKNIQLLVELKGKLSYIEEFKKYYELHKQFTLKLNKLMQYLHYSDLDQTNLDFKRLESMFYNKATVWNQSLSWVEPEIKKIGFNKIKNWISFDKDLKNYEHSIEVFFRFEKYILSENEENLLSKVAKSRHAVNKLYDTLVYADKEKNEIEYKGKLQELTQALYLEIMENSDPALDQDLRIKTNKMFSKDIVSKKHTLAAIYESIIDSSIEEVNIRYNDQHVEEKTKLTPIEYSLYSDSVPIKVYENLLNTGRSFSNLVEDFYLIKKQFFKLDKFYVTDTSLKLTQLPAKNYNVDEGIILVRNALSILGDEYLKELDIALMPGKIDYFEDTNKRSGAYSSGGEGVEPIILMNWDDTINSVNTLAHELGHSVHTLFADKYQDYPNNKYPIILAEVASTVNEHIIFDFMYKKSTNNQEKIYLLQNHIETIIGTFYRQIQFAEFEKTAHEMVMNKETVNADTLADSFTAINEKYGAKVLDKIDTNVKNYSWPRVLHFFHSPFYVYKYATSITVSFKLYEDVVNSKTENLINFLKSGGKDYPLNLLKAAGVDLTQKNVYEPLVKNLQFLINELKTLLLKN